MKIKGPVFLMLCGLVLVSCQSAHRDTNKCGPCPLIAEVAPYLEVRIVDKTSGADLFLSPGSPYQFSDLVVSSPLSGTSLAIGVDNTQKDNRFVRVICTESQTFTFKLAALAPDSVNVVIARDSPVCCPRTRVKRITLDNTLVCSPCSLAQLITIRK